MGFKILLGNGERIPFALGFGNEIIPSGKHLAHRAHMGGNMLDAVQDHALVIAENNVAVLAHELDDEFFAAGISKLVQMLQMKFHHALHIRLKDL